MRAQEFVTEGKVINTYLWHGSRQKIPMLEPRQSVDTGGAAGSNQNAIYATSDPKVAIAMGLTTPGSDTGMFPNDPQMVLFSGKIRKGEYVYLHKLPFNGPDGKPQFVQGGNSREFHSIPGVEGIKPIEIKEIPVNKYLNLIRKATPADLKLRKKYMKEGVAEGNRFDEPLTGYHIVYKNSGNPVLNTPSFETKDQAQKYLMTKMFANHQDFKVVHTANVGVAEGAVEDLAKDLKNPHSYNAIDHMMQTIANKSNVTPKELHNQFVEKYGMTPDEWIKNEQGVEETYGAKLHTEYTRNRFKQLEKIKQQEKALGLGEAGCNMTNEGRYCSEHGMMECPGYSMTETSVQDKLHQQHQELRKKRGLPDPSYYKKLAAQKQAEIDALRAEIAADQAKSMKESLRPGERHHYEDDPKTGKRVYKGIRGDQYDAPKKKTTGHEPDADRDRAAHRAHDRSMTESIESYMEELERAGYGLQEEKVRLDPKCWKGKKIGSPKTKVKGGVRVNNCVPK